MYYPSSLHSGDIKHAVGVTLSKPPDEVVEEFASVLRAPLFDYQIQYGLPSNFLAEGSITTIIVSNHLSIGGKWIVDAAPFGFSVGSDIAYWFGSLNFDGFDNTVKGWTLYPNVSAGYDFERFSVTLKAELNIILAQSKRTGDIIVQKTSALFNGFAIAIYLEQPLWKNNYVLLGFKNNIVKYYYVVWPGFPTFDRYSLVPEFHIGFRL